jgi:hypothetical protein
MSLKSRKWLPEVVAAIRDAPEFNAARGVRAQLAGSFRRNGEGWYRLRCAGATFESPDVFWSEASPLPRVPARRIKVGAAIRLEGADYAPAGSFEPGWIQRHGIPETYWFEGVVTGVKRLRDAKRTVQLTVRWRDRDGFDATEDLCFDPAQPVTKLPRQ